MLPLNGQRTLVGRTWKKSRNLRENMHSEEFTLTGVCSEFMVTIIPFVNHGVYLHVVDESLQFWLLISAIVRTSMNPPKVVRRSKQDSTQDSLHRLSSKHGILKNGFNTFPDLSTSSALVTSNLTKTQWSKDEKAIKAIKAEAEGLRANGTWDDSTVMPVTKLRKRARAKGEDTKIAEVLTLAGIKHHELSPEYHKYKGRIVYRGDVIKDQFNQHVFFTEAENYYNSSNVHSVESHALVRMPDNDFLCRLHSGLSTVPP